MYIGLASVILVSAASWPQLRDLLLRLFAAEADAVATMLDIDRVKVICDDDSQTIDVRCCLIFRVCFTRWACIHLHVAPTDYLTVFSIAHGFCWLIFPSSNNQRDIGCRKNDAASRGFLATSRLLFCNPWFFAGWFSYCSLALITHIFAINDCCVHIYWSAAGSQLSQQPKTCMKCRKLSVQRLEKHSSLVFWDV